MAIKFNPSDRLFFLRIPKNTNFSSKDTLQNYLHSFHFLPHLHSVSLQTPQSSSFVNNSPSCGFLPVSCKIEQAAVLQDVQTHLYSLPITLTCHTTARIHIITRRNHNVPGALVPAKPNYIRNPLCTQIKQGDGGGVLGGCSAACEIRKDLRSKHDAWHRNGIAFPSFRISSNEGVELRGKRQTKWLIL